MELMEAIFELFGKKIVSDYLKFIEDTFPFSEKKDKRIKIFKSIVCGGFAILFILSFVSIMLIIASVGVWRKVGIIVIAVCISITVVYALLGYILKCIAKRRCKKTHL